MSRRPVQRLARRRIPAKVGSRRRKVDLFVRCSRAFTSHALNHTPAKTSMLLFWFPPISPILPVLLGHHNGMYRLFRLGKTRPETQQLQPGAFQCPCFGPLAHLAVDEGVLPAVLSEPGKIAVYLFHRVLAFALALHGSQEVCQYLIRSNS